MTHFPEKTNTITSDGLIFSYFVPTRWSSSPGDHGSFTSASISLPM